MDDEQEVLALGLNFAKAPGQIHYNAIIAATEATCKQLNSDNANQLRTEVGNVLHKAKPPKRNVEKWLQCAIINLEKDNNIVIPQLIKEMPQWSWIEMSTERR